MSVRTVRRRDPKSGATRQFVMIDIDYQHPDGRRERIRRVSPVQTRRGAEQYERQVRAALLEGTFGREEIAYPVPTLEQFKSRFIDEWCRGNKHKPSGIEGKESVFRNYLIPLFGKRRLDTFTATDEDKLKKHFIEYSAATYNNAATLMNVVLKAAVRWKVIRVVPHHFGLLKRQKARPRFLDFDQYEWLVEAASKIDKRTLVVVLLGGDAGLRRGEILAMDWANVDLRRGLLTVERSEWKGNVTATKGMKYRVVPMTKRLQEALAEHRHLRGDRVLYTDDGKTVTAKVLQNWMWKAQKRAGLRATGALHILRHTFCSHLAMRGAPALSIQKLAGHEDLGTTLGYMHLAQGETERAIRLLDDRSSMLGYGNLTATEGDQKINVSN
jgi:integrase